MATVCSAVLLTLLFVFGILAKYHYQKVCGTVVKRLTIGYTAATVPYLILNAIPEKDGKFCIADGFFEQYFGSYEILFTLAISVVLFLKVLKATTITSQKLQGYFERGQAATTMCCRWKVNKLEIALNVSLLILPLLLQWIPFTTNSYGPFAAWVLDSQVRHGLYHKQSWTGTTGSVVGSPIHTRHSSGSYAPYRIAVSDGAHQGHETDRHQNANNCHRLYILSLTLVFGFCAFQAAVYLSALGQDRLTFWLLYAALLPLGAAFIPLALIVTIHLPLSSTIACTQHMCQQQQHGTGDQVEPLGTVTIRDNSAPSLPSETTFHPQHNSYLDSDYVPSAD